MIDSPVKCRYGGGVTYLFREAWRAVWLTAATLVVVVACDMLWAAFNLPMGFGT